MGGTMALLSRLELEFGNCDRLSPSAIYDRCQIGQKWCNDAHHEQRSRPGSFASSFCDTHIAGELGRPCECCRFAASNHHLGTRRALEREAIYHSVAQRLRASERAREMVKVAITLPKGKLVTMYCQREIVKQTISTAPRPDAWKYKMILGVSWIALRCHLVSIGIASLLDQICCVVVLVASTIAFVRLAHGSRVEVVHRLGADGDGAMLWRSSQHDGDEGRSAAYARLALTEEEERTMCFWEKDCKRKEYAMSSWLGA